MVFCETPANLMINQWWRWHHHQNRHRSCHRQQDTITTTTTTVKTLTFKCPHIVETEKRLSVLFELVFVIGIYSFLIMDWHSAQAEGEFVVYINVCKRSGESMIGILWRKSQRPRHIRIESSAGKRGKRNRTGGDQHLGDQNCDPE